MGYLRLLLLSGWVTLTARSPLAETVYRCTVDGRTVYSDAPTGSTCQPREIEQHDPDPAEVERQLQDLRDWNQRREARVQHSMDQEAETETRRRQHEVQALGQPRATASSKGRRSRRSGGSGRGGSYTTPAPTPLPPDVMGPAGRARR